MAKLAPAMRPDAQCLNESGQLLVVQSGTTWRVNCRHRSLIENIQIDVQPDRGDCSVLLGGLYGLRLAGGQSRLEIERPPGSHRLA
jgi:hypothetical protein